TIRARPGQVLALVNGREIKVEDVWPVGGLSATNALEVSPETYQYFLDRAVNRELIFQTARETGLKLNESQRAELARLRAARRQAEPGQVTRLNVDPAQEEFELRDAEAFMLQTSLLAAKGASPNVTEEQMMSYYRDHAADFGGLPTDPSERKEAWSQISFQIRERLAKQTRASFNEQLTAYMNEMKSKATIVVNQ
ncbi:MAG: hypothetical protein H7X97_10715, partial [Opitutaceae bacterium]|nr:hypothetical protein [Verrucomicrobiales bacterium]